jgi:hypothetical protein
MPVSERRARAEGEGIGYSTMSERVVGSLGGWSNQVGEGPAGFQYERPCGPPGTPLGSPGAQAVKSHVSPVTHCQVSPAAPEWKPPRYGPSAIGLGEESQSDGFEASEEKTKEFSAALVIVAR